MAENTPQIKNRQEKFPSLKPHNDPFLGLGKVPPQAVEVEEAVLGALLLEKNALTAVVDIIKEEMFYKPAHQAIYKAIRELFQADQPVDLITVTNKLKTTDQLDLIGGPYYLVKLSQKISSAANIEFHSRIIQERYMQRELIRVSSETIKEAYEESMDVFSLLDKAESDLFDINQNNFRRESEVMSSLVDKSLKQIESAMTDEGMQGVPSGFIDVDRLTGGWQKTDLVVIAARPGMGKTAFVLTMARNIAVDYGQAAAVFSLEMSSVQLVTRLISSETQITSNELRKGNITEKQYADMQSQVEQLVDAPLYIDDTPALSVFDLRAKCRRLKERYDIKIIIIDYLQLMRVKDDFHGNREQEISTISRSLKALSKELNVPVIALSQLNRSVENRPGKRPQLSDIRDSGAVEQDADMVCFLYRPAYYQKMDDVEQGDSKPEDYAEFIVAKHRNGALKDIELTFTAEFAHFSNRRDLQFVPSPEELAPAQNEQFSQVTFSSKMNQTAGEPPAPALGSGDAFE